MDVHELSPILIVSITVIFNYSKVFALNEVIFDANPLQETTANKINDLPITDQNLIKINIPNIEKGSQIESASLVVTVSDDLNKNCILVAQVPDFTTYQSSDTFSCRGTHLVNLNQRGLDLLESKLSSNEITFKIQREDTVNIQSLSSDLSVTSKSPTYFAKIENNIVTNVIVADIDFINKQEGVWVQTYQDGKIRGNDASIGYTYDKTNDVFLPVKPFDSWVLDENWQWKSPVDYPKDGSNYVWDESKLSWVLPK